MHSSFLSFLAFVASFSLFFPFILHPVYLLLVDVVIFLHFCIFFWLFCSALFLALLFRSFSGSLFHLFLAFLFCSLFYSKFRSFSYSLFRSFSHSLFRSFSHSLFRSCSVSVKPLYWKCGSMFTSALMHVMAVKWAMMCINTFKGQFLCDDALPPPVSTLRLLRESKFIFMQSP